MKRKRRHRKPKPFPKLTGQQQKELLDFLMSAHCLPSPSPLSIEARMRELEEMGLEDIPEYEGISSSVRQYAINSLAMEMAKAAGDEVAAGDDEEMPVMITFDEQLLSHAEELAARYGLKPMHPDQLPEPMDSTEIH
jgi:hypothetical protein